MPARSLRATGEYTVPTPRACREGLGLSAGTATWSGRILKSGLTTCPQSLNIY